MDDTIVERHRLYAESRDSAIRELLLKYHDRLAITIANRYVGTGEPWDDLCQVARIGLIKALEIFDPDRNCSFSTMAMTVIKNEIFDHLAMHGHTVKIPPNAMSWYREACRKHPGIEDSTVSEEIINELASESELSREGVMARLGIRDVIRPVSLEQVIVSELGDTTIVEEMIGKEDDDILAVTDYLEMREAITRLRPGCAAYIDLKFYRGMNKADIDRLAGSPRKGRSISPWIFRCLRKLMHGSQYGCQPDCGDCSVYGSSYSRNLLASYEAIIAEEFSTV